MAQFDIYRTDYPHAPFVLDVQASFLDHLETRAVIPLEPPAATPVLPRLHPLIDVQGVPYVMNTAEISHVLAAHLKAPVLSLAASHRQVILDAIDFLLHGY